MAAICTLWMKTGEFHERSYIFYLKFAAFCLSDHEVATYLEGTRPSELGSPSEEDLGIVMRLLIRYCE